MERVAGIGFVGAVVAAAMTDVMYAFFFFFFFLFWVLGVWVPVTSQHLHEDMMQ